MASDSDPPSSPAPIPKTREPQSGGRDKGLTVFGAVGWTLLTLFLALLTLDLSGLVRPGLSRDLVNNQLCFALAFAIGTYLVVRFHLATRSLSDALGARPSTPLIYLLALLTGLALQLPANWLDGLIETISPQSDERLAGMAELFVFTSTAHKIMVAAAATAVGPFLEEIFCRGVLYRAMRRRSSALTVVVASALCFAILHLDPRDMAPVFLSGLVLGLLRALTGSVLVSLIAHMAFNGVVIFAILGGYLKMGERSPPEPWYYGAGGALAVAGLLLAIRALAARSEAVKAALDEDER